MTTPYCTALKLARREVDQIRDQISEAQEEIASLDGRTAVLRAIVAAERSCVADQVPPIATGWFERSLHDGRTIDRRRAGLLERLEELREAGRASLASLHAIQGAAERFRSERRRALARREQAVADDRSATSWFRCERRT